MSAIQSTCALCEIPAKNICSACKNVAYCGVNHQKEHWKIHKKECTPIKIGRNDEVGRFVMVTRDVKVGTEILTESPLVVGPKWYADDNQEINPIVPCVGCFRPCYIGEEQCPRCTWPVCSPDCEGLTDPNQHGIDCKVLVFGDGPSKSDMETLVSYYRTDALFVLRCLLLQVKNYKQWEKLLDMQSHEEERFQTDLYREAERRIVNFLQENFLKKLIRVQTKKKQKFLDQCGPEILHKICGIIETNYMCITTQNGLELSSLFHKGGMIEHSCIPNSYFKFDIENGYRISVIAGRDIQKGEHVKIMYSNILWSTYMRQENLRLTKHFICKCERCTDPTEFGTNFSALLCLGEVGKTCTGYQLPKDPCIAESEWECNTCPVQVGWAEMAQFLSEINNKIETLPTKPPISQLEDLIKNLSQILHPNHYTMFMIKHNLIQRYGTEPGYTSAELTDEQLQNKFQMCEDLLNVCDKIDPYSIRLSLYKAVILYEMQNVLREEADREIKKNPNCKGHARKILKSAISYSKTAVDILAKELDTVAGKSLSSALEKIIVELQLSVVVHNCNV